MTTTTEPMPSTAERSALTDGRLVPALLQAVRDQDIAEQDAHLAFALAVPMVAARLELSTRAIIIVTDNGTALYGPNGLTIAEECEVEARDDEDECEGHESLAGGHMGEAVFCDGSCRPKAKHARRITTYGTGLWRYSCGCGLRDDDFLTRDYAIDGWREAHGLDPVTNYPQV